MKKIVLILLSLTIISVSFLQVNAHSGRTDANGGHKDNKNASGLGSYHYHHGYEAHLHPDGVCPYTTSSANPSPTPPAQAPSTNSHASSQPTYTTWIVEAAQDAISTAKQGGQNSASITLVNEQELTLGTMQQIAKITGESGITFNLNCDSSVDDSLVLRLYVNPVLATKTIQLGGSKTSEHAEKVKSKYQSWYSNDIEVISLSQRESFGMNVELAVKVDSTKLQGDTFHVYVYQESDNTQTKLLQESIYLDAAGYLHITTSLGGDYIITAKELVSK